MSPRAIVLGNSRAVPSCSRGQCGNLRFGKPKYDKVKSKYETKEYIMDVNQNIQINKGVQLKIQINLYEDDCSLLSCPSEEEAGDQTRTPTPGPDASTGLSRS